VSAFNDADELSTGASSNETTANRAIGLEDFPGFRSRMPDSTQQHGFAQRHVGLDARAQYSGKLQDDESFSFEQEYSPESPSDIWTTRDCRHKVEAMQSTPRCGKHDVRLMPRRIASTAEVTIACPYCDMEEFGGGEAERSIIDDALREKARKPN
jgi:hypothetical protein